MPYSATLPERPAAADGRCRPAPLTTQPDGSMSRADAERAIREGDIALEECERKRRLLWDAWPIAASAAR